MLVNTAEELSQSPGQRKMPWQQAHSPECGSGACERERTPRFGKRAYNTM